jgi:hypothetical protein
VKWLVQASAAIFGLALAIGFASALQFPARPDALPGAMTERGLSASGPILQFGLVIILPLITAMIGRRVAPYALEKRWVAISYSIALASAPITLMHFGTVRHVFLHGAVAAAIVTLRRIDPRFSRADVVLIPTLLSCTWAFYDQGFGRTPAPTFLRAAITVFALRLAVGVIAKHERPGRAFILAPLALLFQTQWLSAPVAAAIALPIIFLTPLALVFVRDDRRLTRIAAYVTYPLIVAAYPLTLIGITSAPHVDFFEEGHSILPAAEMARGERPYRDIVPMHGLITDGGADLVAMKSGASSLGTILIARRAVSALNVAAIYFVALAATTSADLALLAAFLSIALFPAATVWLRTAPALGALACTLAGTRLRSRRWFVAAGALIVLAFLVSVDFAIYTTVVTAFAAMRSRSLRPFLTGVAVAAVPVLIAFSAFGFFADYFRVTFGEIPTAGSTYIIGPLDVPECLRTLSALIVNLDNPECLSLLVWLIALIGGGLAFAQSPLRARRSDALWLIALWSVIAAASYVERRHFYFTFVIGAFLVAGLRAMSRHRTATIALAIAIACFARPFSHVFDVASPLRRSHGFPADDLVAFESVPRARGALFEPKTAAGLAAVQKFVATSLRPRETFYDFANAGLLYYLFDRDCPVRHVEVPMYESERGQKEVIAALEHNRDVRAALIAFPTAYTAIDGVPNAERAPLVRRYLEAHFVPAFAENDVVFWTRR